MSRRPVASTSVRAIDAEEEGGQQRILGIDRLLLERILTILRDLYPLADEANYFLESQGVAGINTTITNQRDALSHLVTLLSDDTLDADGQLAQLHHAEEHLRRAIIEPYERAVDLKFADVLEQRRHYIKHVLAFRTHPSLSCAPDLPQLDQKLNYARRLRQAGREAKARNKWNADWEKGVKSLIEAFEFLEKMKMEMATLVSQGHGLKEAKSNKEYMVAGVVLSVIGVAATGLGVYLALA